MRVYSNWRGGFTLIEFVVLGIISAILIVMLIPNYECHKSKDVVCSIHFVRGTKKDYGRVIHDGVRVA